MSMSKRIRIEELQSYLWNSAVLLRTNIDAGAYKQYIFPLLFFKRISDVMMKSVSKFLRNLMAMKKHWNGKKIIASSYRRELTGAMSELFRIMSE